MKRYLTHRIKIVLVALAVICVSLGVAVWRHYPFGVTQYKTITLGMPAAEGAHTPTVWAPPYRTVPESDFYVYALGDEPMCIGSSCGMGGYFVECLGGWLSGYKVITEEFDYGLRDAGVDMEKQKIITVADKNAILKVIEMSINNNDKLVTSIKKDYALMKNRFREDVDKNYLRIYKQILQ